MSKIHDFYCAEPDGHQPAPASFRCYGCTERFPSPEKAGQHAELTNHCVGPLQPAPAESGDTEQEAFESAWDDFVREAVREKYPKRAYDHTEKGFVWAWWKNGHDAGFRAGQAAERAAWQKGAPDKWNAHISALIGERDALRAECERLREAMAKARGILVNDFNDEDLGEVVVILSAPPKGAG